MSERILHAETREGIGKTKAKKLRREGKVPGIFYAHNEKSVPVFFDEREIIKTLIEAEVGLIDVQLSGKEKRKAIIKEVQTDPLKNNPVHIDIMGVKLKEKIHVSVPIRIIGDAPGVKEQGGILHQYMREIEVSCLPLDIPERVDIHVGNLKIGDSIFVSDIKLEKVALTAEPEKPIISIIAPKITAEVPEVAIEAEAEEAATGEETKATKEA